MNFDTKYERAIYNGLQTKYGKDKIITKSYLRAEQAISNSKNTYRFPILKSNGIDVVTEVKLDKNDIFVVTQLGLFIAAQDTTSRGKSILQTYPNEQVFVAAVGTFTPSDLELIYNGKLNIKVGSTVYVENLDADNFRFVPTTQKSGATNKSEHNPNYGFLPATPLIVLDGSKDTEISLDVPIEGSVLMAAVAANTENRIILKTRGFLVKGGAGR